MACKGRLAFGEWVHVVHTYEQGDSRIYVHGVLDGESKTPNAPLNIKSPARLYIGGWYGNYNYVGDLDEVRASKVTRSADWVLKSDGQEKVVATDWLRYTFDAGRVTGDKAVTLIFKAVYPTGVKTKDIAIAAKDDI